MNTDRCSHRSQVTGHRSQVSIVATNATGHTEQALFNVYHS
ncbi:hypothetical protein WEI85_37355 [Actinomycetes bacterium KLBMP 9797]